MMIILKWVLKKHSVNLQTRFNCDQDRISSNGSGAWEQGNETQIIIKGEKFLGEPHKRNLFYGKTM
jgi:hypothetical protein